jgi:NADH-quinone oxidoreductase subunit L
MVTSGVYMVTRMNVLYQLSSDGMTVMMWIGAATAVFAATIGFFQTDIKKVLAYSTVSQLGYMFLACGVGAFAAGIFHLMTHAFFKACLFLGSGSVIHALSGEKDMERMGDLKKHLPDTHKTFFIATLTIAGLPPLAAFFSKDEILWGAFSSGNRLPWTIGLIAAGMTAFYMFRCVFRTFYGESRVTEHAMHHLHESPKVMTVPLWVLAAGSICAGWVGIPAALGGSNRFHHWLSSVIRPIRGAGAEHAAAGHGAQAAHSVSTEYLLMAASVLVALIGIGIAYSLYYRKSEKPDLWAKQYSILYHLIYRKYYVDEIYDALLVQPVLTMCRFFSRFDLAVVDGLVNGTRHATVLSAHFSSMYDNWIIDGIVNLVAKIVQLASAAFRRIQTGRVENYAFILVLGVFIMICFLLFQ